MNAQSPHNFSTPPLDHPKQHTSGQLYNVETSEISPPSPALSTSSMPLGLPLNSAQQGVATMLCKSSLTVLLSLFE